MKTKACIALFLFALVCTLSAADPKIEQALRDLDAEWSKAAGAKDLDKTVSYYSDDAVVLPPNGASATTKDAIRNAWKDVLADTINASWKPTRVEVSQSGDMACVSGTYEWTSKDASGKPVNDRGKYVEVWVKQPDGKWKCGTDIWNSDLPAAAAAPAEKE